MVGMFMSMVVHGHGGKDQVTSHKFAFTGGVDIH